MCADADRTDCRQMPADAGCLVFIVGPSGAGKDTLIRLATAELAGTPGLRIARRIVTRAENRHEDHDSVDEVEFAELSAAGGFCLEWAAHGLRYGIPRAVADDVRGGAVVLCNGSRGAVEAMRRRFERCAVVLVTAPRDVLAERIRARGRDAAAASRLARAFDNWTDGDADLVIDNAGAPGPAAAALVDFVRRLTSRGA